MKVRSWQIFRRAFHLASFWYWRQPLGPTRRTGPNWFNRSFIEDVVLACWSTAGSQLEPMVAPNYYVANWRHFPNLQRPLDFGLPSKLLLESLLIQVPLKNFVALLLWVVFVAVTCLKFDLEFQGLPYSYFQLLLDLFSQFSFWWRRLWRWKQTSWHLSIESGKSWPQGERRLGNLPGSPLGTASLGLAQNL